MIKAVINEKAVVIGYVDVDKDIKKLFIGKRWGYCMKSWDMNLLCEPKWYGLSSSENDLIAAKVIGPLNIEKKKICNDGEFYAFKV